METIAVIGRLHQHRQWVNRMLLKSAAHLTQDQLQGSFEIGQGSIWRSLTHLYAAEYIWLKALNGDENPLAPGDERGQLPGNQLAADAVSSLAELQQHWAELDEQWAAYLAQLTPDSLGDVVYKSSSLTGQRAGTRRVDVLLHVCTHAHYTVAQIINMMRHVGSEQLPDPMLISMARAEQTCDT